MGASERGEADQRGGQLTTVFEDLPCSKIGNLYPELAVEKEILRFKISVIGGRFEMGAYVMVLDGRDVPMDNVLVVHVLDSIDDLRCVIPCACQRQRSQPRYPRLHLAVWCKIQHKDYIASSVTPRPRNGRRT